MHFVWKSDSDNERAYTRAQIVNLKALSGVRFFASESLIGQLPEIKLEITTEYPPADYFKAGPLFILSGHLRTLFESVNALVEYHPVTLLRSHRVLQEREYFLANLLEKVDCFDYEKSVYTLAGDYIDKIEKLSIDESKAEGAPLFRLANSFDVITLASGELVDAVTAAGLTGVKFVEPRDWKW